MQVDIELIDDFFNTDSDVTIGPPYVKDETEKRLAEGLPGPTLFLTQIDEAVTTFPSSFSGKAGFGLALGQGRLFKEDVLNLLGNNRCMCVTIDLPRDDRQIKEGIGHSSNHIRILQRTAVKTKGLALFDSMVPDSIEEDKAGDGKVIISGSADNKVSIDIRGPNLVAQGVGYNNEISSTLESTW